MLGRVQRLLNLVHLTICPSKSSTHHILIDRLITRTQMIKHLLVLRVLSVRHRLTASLVALMTIHLMDGTLVLPVERMTRELLYFKSGLCATQWTAALSSSKTLRAILSLGKVTIQLPQVVLETFTSVQERVNLLPTRYLIDLHSLHVLTLPSGRSQISSVRKSERD